MMERQVRMWRDAGLLGPEVWVAREEAKGRVDPIVTAAAVNRRLRIYLEEKGLTDRDIDGVTDLIIEEMIGDKLPERRTSFRPERVRPPA